MNLSTSFLRKCGIIKNVGERFFLCSNHKRENTFLSVTLYCYNGRRRRMFFINRKNIIDFQNRCVIALFLDYHTDVVLEEYIEKNHFRGRISHNNLIEDIYLFNVPHFIKGKEDRGIVFKYSGAKTKRNFEYISINNDFVQEYVEFKNNPYDYICRFFAERNWSERYSKLLVSDFTEFDLNISDSELMLVKYKSDPTNLVEADYKNLLDEKKDIPDRLKYFMNSLDGELAFTKPDWLNDPFDCDCEIPIMEIFPFMLRGAMLATRYHADATSAIDEYKLLEWWNSQTPERKKDIIADFDNLSLFNSDFNSEAENNARSIIEELYKKYQNKNIGYKKSYLILLRYCSMRNRLVNLKNEFRILSLAHSEKDILMWGYYGNSGQGVCLRHKQNDIRNGIIKSKDAKKYHADFCIYGEMNYTAEKPKFNPTSGVGVDGILEYIIECVFTKYNIWEHEKEYRYVLMGRDVKDSGAICIKSNLEHRFMGVKYNDVQLYKEMDRTNTWPDRNKDVDYLVKHSTKYELITK